MKELVTKKFILSYQDGLDDFIERSLKIVDERMPLIDSLFDCNEDTTGQLKASFFTKREDFVEYIKSISGEKNFPTWVTGCFYNGEIQTLININDEDDVKFKTHTLTHEMVHLYIENTIYSKYNIDRIRWFDESYAGYLDGHMENRTNEQLKELCLELKMLGNFDMNSLDDVNDVITKSYNGYNMFRIIGKYIFENDLAKKYLDLLKNNPSAIREIGKDILPKAIEYVENSL